MNSQLDINYTLIFYLPYLVMFIWLLYLSTMVVFNKNQNISTAKSYKPLHFIFLVIGVLGAFWNVLFGFFEINAINNEMILGSNNQIKGLENAVGVLIIGILFFVGFQLPKTKNRPRKR